MSRSVPRVWTDQNKAHAQCSVAYGDRSMPICMLLGMALYGVISCLWICKHWVTVQSTMVDMATPPETGQTSEEYSAYWIFADGPWGAGTEAFLRQVADIQVCNDACMHGACQASAWGVLFSYS